MTGFVLSVILTAIPFRFVMGISTVQIVVHMIYFLHTDPHSESGWTPMALIFTLIIVGIALAGSLWVMHHLNVNMMPMPPKMMENMP